MVPWARVPSGWPPGANATRIIFLGAPRVCPRLAGATPVGGCSPHYEEVQFTHRSSHSQEGFGFKACLVAGGAGAVVQALTPKDGYPGPSGVP